MNGSVKAVVRSLNAAKGSRLLYTIQ